MTFQEKKGCCLLESTVFVLSRLVWFPLGVELVTAKPQYPFSWAILYAICSYHQRENKSTSKPLCRYHPAQFLTKHPVLSVFTQEWQPLFFSFFPLCVCAHMLGLPHRHRLSASEVPPQSQAPGWWPDAPPKSYSIGVTCCLQFSSHTKKGMMLPRHFCTMH